MAEETVDMNKYAAEERRDYASFFNHEFKRNKRLTPQQKAFARTNMDRLVDWMAWGVSQIRQRNTDSEKWLKEIFLRQEF